MAQDKEPFLSRWSRLKQETRAEPAAPVAGKKEDDKPVPPVESLTPESDFTAFMQPKVKEELRRAALKKLFQDPHFNLPDLFEPYSRDWTVGDPIPPDLLARLNQARTVLLTPEERQALEEQENRQETPTKEAKADEPGSESA